MEGATLVACQRCGKDIAGQMVNVAGYRGFGPVRHYHPECHQCTVCRKPIPVGTRFTVEKDGPKCRGCWDAWAAQVASMPQGGGGKPSGERGYVWNQVWRRAARKEERTTKKRRRATQVSL